jgi:hypothetical protein
MEYKFMKTQLVFDGDLLDYIKIIEAIKNIGYNESANSKEFHYINEIGNECSLTVKEEEQEKMIAFITEEDNKKPNGEIHIYKGGNDTLCGEEIDENWFIENTIFSDYKVTCKKCKNNY